jgi:hypothetical protein
MLKEIIPRDCEFSVSNAQAGWFFSLLNAQDGTCVDSLPLKCHGAKGMQRETRVHERIYA